MTEEVTEIEEPPQKKAKVLGSLIAAIQAKKKGTDETAPASTPPQLTPREKIEKELNLYMGQPEASSGVNPLDWWKTRAAMLPLLSQIARRYLGIPATSCASERVFSSSGLICNAKRSTLNADNVEMLVFLAQNYAKCQQP